MSGTRNQPTGDRRPVTIEVERLVVHGMQAAVDNEATLARMVETALREQVARDGPITPASRSEAAVVATRVLPASSPRHGPNERTTPARDQQLAHVVAAGLYQSI